MEDESVSGDAIRFEIGGGGAKTPCCPWSLSGFTQQYCILHSNEFLLFSSVLFWQNR